MRTNIKRMIVHKESITRRIALLAPLEIGEVMLDDATIKFHQPLVLIPAWLPDDPDEPDENEYLSVKLPALAIDSFGANREELQSGINSDIRFAWRHFVSAKDEELTPSAQTVKYNYLFYKNKAKPFD